MKKLILIIASLFILITTPWEISESTITDPVDYKEVEKHIRDKQIVDSYYEFKEHLGFLESSNRYHIRSRSGSYLGKYQFGYIALREIGMDQYYPFEFLRSPYLQEKALYKNLIRNKFYLQDIIENFDGKRINGILITESSILAGAHLLGAYTVRKYFLNHGRIEMYDGNGTPLSYYLMQFSDKKFELDNKIIIHIEQYYGRI